MYLACVQQEPRRRVGGRGRGEVGGPVQGVQLVLGQAVDEPAVSEAQGVQEANPGLVPI